MPVSTQPTNQPNYPKLTYLLCIGAALPQVITQAYSAYFKLDGFNNSIKDVNSIGKINIPLICEALIICLMAIYVFSFITYTIFPVFEDLPKALTESKEEPLKDVMADKFAYKKYNILTGKEKALFAGVTLLALTNTALYAYTSFYASNDTFFNQPWCKSHRLALSLAIICTVGAVLKDFSYTIPKTIKAFPDIFNILNLKKLYWDLVGENTTSARAKRIACGLLLVILAGASIPLSLITISYSKLPPWLALPSALLSMVIIYTTSVSNLCSEEIKANIHGIVKTSDDKKNKNGFGWITCSALFYISCLIPAVGMGFSWEKMLHSKMPLFAFAGLISVFAGMSILAFFGRVIFCNKDKTIAAMRDSPKTIKKGCTTLFCSSSIPEEEITETSENSQKQTIVYI